MTRLRQTASHRESVPLPLAGVVTVLLVLLANRLEEIGERIPLVFLSLWVGSSTVTALVFLRVAPRPGLPPPAPDRAARRSLWRRRLWLAGIALLPLSLVPLLEVGRSGYDPALWLMDGALVMALCGVPYFTLLAQSLVGGVVLSVALPSLLWSPVSGLLGVPGGHPTLATRRCRHGRGPVRHARPPRTRIPPPVLRTLRNDPVGLLPDHDAVEPAPLLADCPGGRTRRCSTGPSRMGDAGPRLGRMRRAKPVNANHEPTSLTLRIPRDFPRTMGPGHPAGGNPERD